MCLIKLLNKQNTVPGFIRLALLNSISGFSNINWCFLLSQAVCGGTLSTILMYETSSCSIR